VSDLAQQLGFGCEDRLLIVNCDDVGSSHSANVAAFRAMTYGIATSASLTRPTLSSRDTDIEHGWPSSHHHGRSWVGQKRASSKPSPPRASVTCRRLVGPLFKTR
jgi:hypothetical protein